MTPDPTTHMEIDYNNNAHVNSERIKNETSPLHRGAAAALGSPNLSPENECGLQIQQQMPDVTPPDTPLFNGDGHSLAKLSNENGNPG